jgi:hypothetical protein
MFNTPAIYAPQELELTLRLRSRGTPEGTGMHLPWRTQCNERDPLILPASSMPHLVREGRSCE